jgi:hypothetical protein
MGEAGCKIGDRASTCGGLSRAHDYHNNNDNDNNG